MMPLKNLYTSFIPNARARNHINKVATSPFAKKAFQTITTKLGNNDQFSSAFHQAGRVYGSVVTALDAIRVGAAGVSAITGLLPNGENSPTNGAHSSVPFLSNSSVSPLGRNEAILHKTRVHVGRSTSQRITEIASGPYVEKVIKNTSSTLADYQDHGRRKNLTLTSGFCEKGFSFFLEDTYFSVEDYYKMFDIQNRFGKQIEENEDGVKEIYGCVYKTHNRFIFKNRNSNCTCHIKLHLVKILDIRTTVRSLLQEITHNSVQTTSNNSGRLPKEFQYQDPDIYETTNRFACSFLTNLSCKLTHSTKFKEKAKIVKSWHATLPPSSLWQFDLTNHLGRGIYLNRINDLYLDEDTVSLTEKIDEQLESFKNAQKTKNGVAAKTVDSIKSALDSIFVKRSNEHPSSYVFVAEYVGDRRATVQRKEDGDLFSGYSGCDIGVEFDTFIEYLVSQENGELLVYKNIQQDRNFEEGSSLAELFCPSRQIPFHVPHDNIGSGTRPFKMVYDQVIGSDSLSFMDNLKQTFKDLGLDPNSATPDDLDFNYQGADTPAPPLDEEDEENL